MRRAGEELGGYVVARWLGSGGMGSVYEVIDADGRHVALKLLHPHLGADPVARSRLRREVETLQRVRHPGVARLLDAEADSDEAFVVTELVDGATLDDLVREGGPLDRVALADLARELHGALTAIHAAGVVHRDVKPTNVMLTSAGPVLIDFGISQVLDADRYTQTGLVTGTPGYLDPRLTAGEDPDARTDWWSWAAVLAFAATGRPPFGRGPQALTLSRAAAGDLDVAGVPEDLARAFTAALRPTGRRLEPADLLAVIEGDPAGAAALAAFEDAGQDQADGDRTSAADPTAVLPAERTAVLPATVPPEDLTDVLPRLPADPTSVVAPPPPPPPPPGPSRDGWSPYSAPAPVPPPDGGSPYSAPAPVPGSGADAVPAVAPPAPARTGLLFVLLLVATSLAASWPGAVLVGVVGLMLVAGAVGSGVRMLRRRRVRRGRPDGGVAGAWLLAPWHVVRAAAVCVVAVLAGALAGGTVWLVAWAVVTEAPIGQETGDGPVAGAVTAGAAAAAIAVAWLVPPSLLLREGAREVVATLLPTRGARVLVVLAGLLVALVVAVPAVVGLTTPHWAPLPAPVG